MRKILSIIIFLAIYAASYGQALNIYNDIDTLPLTGGTALSYGPTIVYVDQTALITLPSTFCLGDSILIYGVNLSAKDSSQFYALNPVDSTALAGTFSNPNGDTTYYTPAVGETEILIKLVTYKCGDAGCKFYLASADGSADQSYTIKIPVGKFITLDWGDESDTTITGAGESDIMVSHHYSSSGDYDIYLTGDFIDMTYISVGGNSLSGNISDWKYLVNLTHLNCGNNSLTGDISSWSSLTNLTYINVYSNDLSGDLSGWSALINLEYLILYANEFTGDISGWSAMVDMLYLRGYANDFTGDISQLRTMTNLTHLHMGGNNLTFDSTDAWPALDLGANCNLSNNGMDSTMVNNAIIAFSGGPFTGTTINLNSNAARTSTSDSAVAILESNDCTVLTD